MGYTKDEAQMIVGLMLLVTLAIFAFSAIGAAIAEAFLKKRVNAALSPLADGYYFGINLRSPRGITRTTAQNDKEIVRLAAWQLVSLYGVLGMVLSVIGALLGPYVASKFVDLSQGFGLAPLAVGIAFGLWITWFYLKKSPWVEFLRASRSRDLDWDAEGQIHGIGVKIRFHNKKQDVESELDEKNYLSRDSLKYCYGTIIAKPDLVVNHGNGWVVVEYKSRAGTTEALTPQNWLQWIRLKDVLQSIISAYVVSLSCNSWVVCLLRYSEATVMLTPMHEQLTWLRGAAYNAPRGGNNEKISASDLADLVETAFRTQFAPYNIRGLEAHKEILSARSIKL